MDMTHEKPISFMPSITRNLWNTTMICVMSHSTGYRSLYSQPQKPLSRRN